MKILEILSSYENPSIEAFTQLRYALKSHSKDPVTNKPVLPISDLLARMNTIIKEKGYVNVFITGLPGVGKSVLMTHFTTHLRNKGQSYEKLNHEDILNLVAQRYRTTISEISPNTDAWEDYEPMLRESLAKPVRTQIRAVELPAERGADIVDQVENKVIIELVGSSDRQERALKERELVLSNSPGSVIDKLATVNTYIINVEDLGLPMSEVEKLIRERYSSMAQRTDIARLNSEVEEYVTAHSGPKLERVELVDYLAKRRDPLIVTQVRYYQITLGDAFTTRDKFIVYTPRLKRVNLDARSFLGEVINPWQQGH